ncbi:MAG: T9SS type A sorting domain-containing protein, partial [Bacteroidota bacterium]
YALFGDSNNSANDYSGRNIMYNTNYSIRVEAIDEFGASDSLLAEKEINFSFRPMTLLLIDADTDNAVGHLEQDGQMINVNLDANTTLSNFNISAIDLPDSTTSVKFEIISAKRFDGSKIDSITNFSPDSIRVENTAPYALFGDSNNSNQDFEAQAIQHLDQYTIRVSAFSATSGGGKLLGSTEISFQFLDFSLLDLALVDANSDNVIGTLENGQKIDLADFSSPNEFNLEATNTPNETKSVTFEIVLAEDSAGDTIQPIINFGPLPSLRNENSAPYALFGDSNNSNQDFEEQAINPGDKYRLIARAYSGTNASGVKLAEIEFNLEFFMTPAEKVNSSVVKTHIPLPDKVYPNSFGEEILHLQLPEATQGSLHWILTDMRGQVRRQGQHKREQEDKEISLDLQAATLPVGAYILIIQGPNYQSTHRLIKR